ncbi:unnamed protein product, partial [Mesorhabditis spiculigera]
MDPSALPPDVLSHIAGFLSPAELLNFASASRALWYSFGSVPKDWTTHNITFNCGQSITILNEAGETELRLKNQLKIGLLLRNSHYGGLTLRSRRAPPGYDGSMRVDRLYIEARVEPYSLIERHMRPPGFSVLTLSRLHPAPEKAEFLNNATERLCFSSTSPLDEYLYIKIKSMKITVPAGEDHQIVPYVKRVLEEWKAKEREIWDIRIEGTDIPAIEEFEDYYEEYDPYLGAKVRCGTRDHGLVLNRIRKQFGPDGPQDPPVELHLFSIELPDEEDE